MKAIKFLFTGIFFGIVLTKSEAVSWYRIVEMFRFESFHMYGIIGSAVITGIVLLQLSKRFKMNTTEGNPIALPEKAKQYKKALFGGSIFGLGWALAGACPGPMFILFGAGYYIISIVILASLLGTFVYGLVAHKLP
ncbi:MAG: YeeE/YedE thiosulfate transporter family protein [Flavobacteriaceae bacterium]|nr:YeeE/YedE thiosulfate transporter family protein [Flavobacteriaceae bacterium]